MAIRQESHLLFPDGVLIQDGNGNEVIAPRTAASAVNYVDVTNAATGVGPSLLAAGDDADVDLIADGKGTGQLTDAAGNPYLTALGALSRIGASTYSSVQHLQDIFHSSGWTSGGAITDAGGGNIDVAAGTGLVRATDSQVAELSYFDWSAASGTAIPSDTVRYVGVEYNGGSPQVVVRSSYDWDFNTDFPLGEVVNEGGTLYIYNASHAVGDHASTMIQRAYETMPATRDKRNGGLIISETGTRNVAVSAGGIWERLEEFDIAALDTSISGSFDRYYRDGASGHTRQSSETQWNNTQYDDGTGTLATLSAATYSVQYIYATLDDAIVSVYGQGGEYSTLAEAEADPVPSDLPDRLTGGRSLLLGRIIFQKSDSSAQSVESAFSTTFEGSGVSDHGALGGLADDDHTQYLLADGTRSMTGSLDLAASTSLTINSVAIIADSGGTATLSNIDALDATTEATIEAAIDSLSNLTTLGTITSGTWNADLAADTVDDIGEIAAALRTGVDVKLVTGTEGTDQNLIEWNADGDAIDSGIAAADVASAVSDTHTQNTDTGTTSTTFGLNTGGVEVKIKASGGELQARNAGDTAYVNFSAEDVLVNGDLTVNGTTTTVNSEVVTIDDNIIVLNNNETGTPSENAGVEVERGTSTNSQVQWDETSDHWALNDGTTTKKAARVHSELVGDTAATEITVNHALATNNVTVSVRYDAGTMQMINVDWRVIDADNIRVDFASAPATDEFRVTVVG